MSQLAVDLAAVLARRQVLGGLALGLGGATLAACGSRAVAQGGGLCATSPTETRGPFPADGDGGRGRLNVLALEGVVRRDIRPSFAGLRGMAEGVPLELELRLTGAGDCAPLGARAVYLWQNDATGEYSLYTKPEVNYLRGLQTADADGRVRFTAIVPGAYGGRYPHLHFEVFSSQAAAIAGEAPLLVSQLAYPTAECRDIYRTDARYGSSLARLEALPIDRDSIFADASPEALARQTIALTGEPGRGYRGTATVNVRTG